MKIAMLVGLGGVLLPAVAGAQVNALDSLRRAESNLLEGAYDSAQAKLEGLLQGELAAPATLYLGWIQFTAGDSDSARVLIRRVLLTEFSLDIEQHRAYVSDDYIRLFSRMRDDLAEQNPAYITVAAHPWANVVVDDEERGATPLRAFRITPGRHVVALSRDGFRRQTETINLAPGTRRLIGPVTLQPRMDTIVTIERPLRELSARHDWSLRAMLALDSGDTETARRELGPEPQTDSLRGTWLAIQGISEQLAGATDVAQQRYQRAIEASPDLRIGLDDLNPAVARLFANSREAILPTVSFIALSPESIQVNRDELYLQVSTNRARRVLIQLREIAGGKVVWRADTAADSLMSIGWNGRRSNEFGDEPVASGRYELLVRPLGRAGLPGTGFTQLVDIRSVTPDTSADVGDIPDSLLVKETRGGGTRVASIVQGLLFGAAAGGLAYAADVQWDLPGLEPASGAVVVGASTAVLGIIGAIVLNTHRPVPERVEKNARARAQWEKQRGQLRDLNRLRLTRPYPMIVKVAK